MIKDNFENQLFAITTIIITEFTADDGKKYTGTASGFYYTITSSGGQDTSGPHWERIDGYQLITNRHVLFPEHEGKEYFIDTLIFCLREIIDNRIEWIPIKLSKDDIIAHTKLHPNQDVDVVVIDVYQYIHELIKKTESRRILIPTALTAV